MDPLALMFRIGGSRFALRCADLVEVVPRVPCRPLAHAPAYVVGTLMLRGDIVPVIDLGLLIAGTASAARLSTRIMLVRYPVAPDRIRVLGLIGEHVTDAKPIPTSGLRPSGVDVPEAPYLGELFDDEGQLTQLVRIDELLPAALRATLFTEEAAS